MRNEIDLTISAEGRDYGKKFHIKEMSAMQGARFALKAFSRMVRAGMDVPKTSEDQGMIALAKAGYACLVAMPFELSEELLDELMGCVQCVASEQVTRKLTDGDIEEIKTVLTLQKAVYDLHISFFQVGGQSISESVPSASKKTMLNIPTRR
jgi:hypothetical protein